MKKAFKNWKSIGKLLWPDSLNIEFLRIDRNQFKIGKKNKKQNTFFCLQGWQKIKKYTNHCLW